MLVVCWFTSQLARTFMYVHVNRHLFPPLGTLGPPLWVHIRSEKRGTKLSPGADQDLTLPQQLLATKLTDTN